MPIIPDVRKPGDEGATGGRAICESVRIHTRRRMSHIHRSSAARMRATRAQRSAPTQLRRRRRRAAITERILSNNPSRRATREASEVDAMTQIRASESGTLVRHGLRRHRRVHPHTRACIARRAALLLVPPVRAYVTRGYTRALTGCACMRFAYLSACILGE